MSRSIGIDPGASGAIVLLENSQPIEWILMPMVSIGKASRVNAAALADFIQGCECQHAYVEKVGAMPGQGVSSMFNFGHSCGTVMGVLGALRIPQTLVTPQQWKNAAGLIGTEKDAARARAIQLWPNWRDLDKKGKGQALADAALIAKYGGPKH
jgi:crossover junction endodeoxyribonuclease RuvC